MEDACGKISARVRVQIVSCSLTEPVVDLGQVTRSQGLDTKVSDTGVDQLHQREAGIADRFFKAFHRFVPLQYRMAGEKGGTGFLEDTQHVEATLGPVRFPGTVGAAVSAAPQRRSHPILAP